jgi:DNA segregation ATPase FtsK/SpoIIIE, S-DNA-T family
MARTRKRRTTARRKGTRRTTGRSKRKRSGLTGAHLTRARKRVRELDQRQLDLIGMGLVAAGVFFSLVFYLGWDGGKVGEGIAIALRFLTGAVAYVTPLVLLGCGAGLILKPFLPSLNPLKLGGAAIVAGLLLGFAAQTLGFGPNDPRSGYFHTDYYMDHGGLLGEVLYWAASTLFQRVGAHILTLVLLFGGLMLLTQTSISAFAEQTGRAFGAARNRLRTSTSEFARLVHHRFEHQETEPVATEQLAEDPEADVAVDAGLAPPIDHPFEEDDPEIEVHIPASGKPSAGQGRDDVERTPMGVPRGVTASDEVAYELPTVGLLRQGGPDQKVDTADQERVGRLLVETLGHFGIEASVVGTVTGPHVSRFELRLAPGIKVSKVAQLKDDLAYALAATDIRIQAPIPGKQAVGVEVPNQRRKLVTLGDIYQDRPKGASPLTVWLGKDVGGATIPADLARMPHILVAGTTGSGKSGCINAMLSSVLLHASPNEVRMVLVDPKGVELNHYEAVPHLLTPVVTLPRVAANVLGNLIGEMETRYGLMSEVRTRSLIELNRARRKAGDPPLPYILCVIDELADLMMVASKEVEDYVIRLAQKSRAVGIHLVLATQRPSVDVITGMIKANIPARIAFAVASGTDSGVILDSRGAETLLGQGDMLFRPAGTSKVLRVQGAYITEDEIAALTEHWSAQGEPEFQDELLEARQEADGDGEGRDGEFSPDRDELLEEAIRTVVQAQTAAVSMLQRRLRVGYTRAGRLIDMLERRGVISGYEGSKPRQVLITEGDLPRVLAGLESTSEPGDPEPGDPETGELEPVSQ